MRQNNNTNTGALQGADRPNQRTKPYSTVSDKWKTKVFEMKNARNKSRVSILPSHTCKETAPGEHKENHSQNI